MWINTSYRKEPWIAVLDNKKYKSYWVIFKNPDAGPGEYCEQKLLFWTNRPVLAIRYLVKQFNQGKDVWDFNRAVIDIGQDGTATITEQ